MVVSSTLTLALGLIAILSVIPAPGPVRAISLSTIVGRALYLFTILVLTAWAWSAHRKERVVAKFERESLIDGIEFIKHAVSARAAVEKTGALGEPLLSAIDDSEWVVSQMLTMPRQRPAAIPAHLIQPSVAFSEATELLGRVSVAPPSTAEAVQEAAQQLRHYVIEAEPGEVRILGGEATLTHRDREEGDVKGQV